MYYKYTQNNSGGSFITNDKVAETVIIEAHSHLEANAIAEEIGIYFDGCATGGDCSCCGDRWYRVADFDAREKLDVDEWEVKRRKVYLYTDAGKNKIVVTEATVVAIDGKEEPSEPVVEDNPPVENKVQDEAENKRALNTTEIEAAVIYRLFVDAVALPTIYNKKSIELAINTIKEEYYKHIEAEEEEEKRIVEEFIKYLENIK